MSETTSRGDGKPGSARIGAALLATQFASMLAAFIVLATSIDWPASLDLPASEMLPLLILRFPAVFSGYAFYLFDAALLIPVAVLVRDSLGISGPMGNLIVTLGVLAGLAKSLGIVRWLFMMPVLAETYVAESTGPETRAAISVVFDAFNAYAGGVGELLGVAFFSGVWTILIATVLWSRGLRVMAGWGGLASVLLFWTLLSVFGYDMPMVLTVSGFLWQFWMFALAIVLWRGLGHVETGS